jgi:hypothetical protein
MPVKGGRWMVGYHVQTCFDGWVINKRVELPGLGGLLAVPPVRPPCCPTQNKPARVPPPCCSGVRLQPQAPRLPAPRRQAV